MKLGEKIKMLRTEQEMTQPDLADKAGIEQSYLSKLENDKGSPSFDIINRIAMALGTSGMDLINSLSQRYIEGHLAHIPEVAAEYENIRQRREISLKKRFLLASLCIVLGAGALTAGITELFFPEIAYDYSSDGVILESEPIEQFNSSQISEIMETDREREERLLANKARFDRVFKLTHEYRGRFFIEEVPDGRRLYQLGNTPHRADRPQNGIIITAGIMLIVSGMLILFFGVRFRR